MNNPGLSPDALFLPILVLVSVLVQVCRRVHPRLRYRASLALAPVVLALLGGALLTLGSQTQSVTAQAVLDSLLLTGNAAAEAAANPDLNSLPTGRLRRGSRTKLFEVRRTASNQFGC